MDQEQLPEEIIEDQNQSKAIEPEASDVDFKHVRGLMYTLVTICVFCASILLGPDGQILPKDGDLDIPIINLTVKQGSFLYFGPVIIICVSMYTYLFLLNILTRVKTGQVSSDQYIFTMKNYTAQIATNCIFFGLPALVLFGFAYKALPRAESANLIGLFLIFLIFVVSIQLLLYVFKFKFRFLSIAVVSVFCVVLVLSGFVEDGWLNDVRLKLHTERSMTLENADFKNRDLKAVDIRNAKAESITLTKADLRGAVIKDSYFGNASLEGAILENAELECTSLKFANFKGADLRSTKLFYIDFYRANLNGAKLSKAKFHTTAKIPCKETSYHLKTSLYYANLEEAVLSKADLSNLILDHTYLNGAKLTEAKIIGTTFATSYFQEKINLITKQSTKTDLTRADLRCSRFMNAKMNGAILIKAGLGGTDLSGAILNNADLTEANFYSLNCSESCEKSYINDCSSQNIRDGIKGCVCEPDEKDPIAAKLIAAKLQFADLKGSTLKEVDLSDADLRGADLHDADLSGANLLKADIMFAKLSSTKELTCKQLESAKNWKASFRDDDLVSKCGEESLNFVDLDETLTDQERFDLRCVFEKFVRSSRIKPSISEKESGQLDTSKMLGNAKMSGINLRNAVLGDIFLNQAQLVKANLRNTNLKGARLIKADLTEAQLRNADLRDAYLREAIFAGADLSRADLGGAKMEGVILKGANLKGANLKGVEGLDCLQFKLAKNWKESYWDNKGDCKGESQSGSYPKKPPFGGRSLSQCKL